MNPVWSGLRVSIAVLELIVWLPASCMGLMATAAYTVAGNEPPPTLLAGLLLVPITFLIGPVYALSSAGRRTPAGAAIALAVPLLALALSYVAELPSLT